MTFKRLVKCIVSITAALSVLFSAAVTNAAEKNESADRIYFYNISGNGAISSDMILIESEGHFGLIDTGHRYADTIEDEDGTSLPASMENGLSSQVAYKNGRDAARYMNQSLGVTHLDFIIGTHSHSDHIGGVPEIAELEFTDKEGNTRHLVDENTVYFYKNYYHISNKQDDMKTKSSTSWHNQAFNYQAVKAMSEQGAQLAELSHGVFINSNTEGLYNFSDVTKAVNQTEGLSGAKYFRGALNDYYDDFVIFNMGNLTIRLYNLFSHNTTRDENVNSIITVVTDGSSKFVSLADINVQYKAEQKLAKAIYDDIGKADLLKVAHHGTVSGSNSKEMLDLLQPKYAAVTRSRGYAYGTNGHGAFSAAMMYARKNFKTVFYEVGASDFGIAAEFTDGGFDFYNVEGVGKKAALTSAEDCKSNIIPVNGWSDWDVEWTNLKANDTVEHYYFINGETIPNWYEEDGYWYYLDTNSKKITGWMKYGGKWYYFDNNGVMLTEWQKISGVWYYFGTDGKMNTEWQKINGKWYYFNSSGAMQKGWQKIGGKWYYFSGSGDMQTGWKKLGSSWYYFNSNGTMKTGWLKLKGKWYYLDKNGKMVTGKRRINGVNYTFSSNGVMK